MSDNKKLLLVEDESIIAMVNQQELQNCGYEVLISRSGEDALERIYQDSSIDLVLMDIDLGPGMDGTECASRILEIKELPVVFLSSHTEAEMVAKTEKISSYGYIVKNSGVRVMDASIKMAFRLFAEKQKVLKQKEKLQQSEQQYRLLSENLQEGVWRINQQAVTDYVNPAMAIMLGYRAEEMLGRHLFDFMDDEEIPAAKEKLAQRRKGKNDTHEFTFLHKMGHRIYTRMATSALLDDNNTFQGAIAAVTDISKQKKVNDREIFHKRLLSLINTKKQDKQLIRQILIDLAAFCQVDTAAVRIQEGNDYPYYCAIGFNSDFIKHGNYLFSEDQNKNKEDCSKEENYCLCKLILKQQLDKKEDFISPKGCFWTDQMTEFLQTHKEYQCQYCFSAGFLSMALVPITVDHEIIGLLQLADKKTGSFKEDLVDFLESMGPSLGIAIQRVIQERKMQERLKEFRCLYEFADLVEKSENQDDILRGLLPLIKRAWQYPDDCAVRIIVQEKEYLSQNFQETEWKQACPIKIDGKAAGQLEVFYAKAKPEMDKGPFLREEEKLLYLLAERLGHVIERFSIGEDYKQLFESLNEALILTDTAGTIRQANQAAANLCAYASPAQLIGLNMESLYLNPRQKKQIELQLQNKQQELYNFEFMLKQKDGTGIPCLCNIRFMKDAQQNFIGTLSAIRDLSTIKAAREELLSQKDHLQTIINTIPSPVFFKDSLGRYTGCNPAFEEFIGYSLDQIIGKTVFDLSSQGLADSYREKDEKLLSGKVKKQHYESIIEQKNGSRRHVLLDKAVLTGPDGKIQGLVGIISDISHQKRLEGQLEKHRNRLGDILSNLNTGLFLINRDMTIEWVNDKILEMFPGKEPVGALCHILFEGNYSPCANCGTRESFLSGKPVMVDRYNSLYKKWYRLFSTPIKDSHGYVINVLESITDITKDKLAEKALQESEILLREVINSMEKAIAVYEVRNKGEDFIIVDMNTFAKKITGLEREDVMGRSIRELFPAVEEFGLMEKLRSVYRTGQSEFLPLQEYKDKRIVRQLENYIFKLPSGRIAALFEDSSERRKTELALKKSEENLRKALDEKEVLLRELQHRVKNSFATILSLIKLKKMKSDNKSEKYSLAELASRVSAISELYSLLYQSGANNEVELDLYFKKVIGALMDSSMQPLFQENLDKITIDIKSAAVLGLILTEMLTNALKYAFPEKEDGIIKINLFQKNSKLVLEVIDNGVGLPEGFNPGKSRGMGIGLIKTMTAQLRGHFEISNQEKGCLSRIEIDPGTKHSDQSF